MGCVWRVCKCGECVLFVLVWDGVYLCEMGVGMVLGFL